MDQMPQQQILAAAAAQELVDFLGMPINASQLLSRAIETTRSAIEAIEASVDTPMSK
ncbi:hypothetical protein NPS53_09140 [Pseudomonas putida]|uniref:hypothetical protein n=1 Tax=Pseudomonas putida TaxID=303 RepID=UPI0023648528|nr:hypothetical protein [Pseudomonas putida]MDD2139740.1 hypothetical protein [Pseudomonas putida]HDS1721664.1 hypothetical protein [Pseudomonas putida]